MNQEKENPQRTSIKGIITDKNQIPVEDVIVMIVDGPHPFEDIASVSGVNGEFQLNNIYLPGTYTLQLNKNNRNIKVTLPIKNSKETIRLTLD